MVSLFKNDVRWTAAGYEREKRVVQLGAETRAAEAGSDGVLTFLSEAVQTLDDNTTVDGEQRRFASIVALLEWHAKKGGLSAADVSRLRETGEAMLKAAGIEPLTSKLSFLYGELVFAEGRIARRLGQLWQANWQAGLGVFLARGAEESAADGLHARAVAEAAIRRGDAMRAVEGFRIAEKMAAGEDAQIIAAICRLERLKALRLSARLEEVRDLVRVINRKELSAEGAEILAWEELRCEAQATGDLAPLVQAVGRGGAHRGPERLLEAGLWVKAAKEKRWLGRVPKPETVRRTGGDDFRRGSPLQALYEASLALERCYDGVIPLKVRLESLGEALAKAKQTVELDTELLIYAAAARWLVRHHQALLAAPVLADYRALSFRLTDGVLGDVLGLVSDIDANAWARFGEAAQREAQVEHGLSLDMKTSRLSRAAEIGKLTLGVAGTVLTGKVKRLGRNGSVRAAMKQREMEEIAVKVMRAVGGLRGPYVKFGQILAFIAPNLPAPIKEAVSAMRESIEPMDSALIRRVVEAEFKKPIEELFAAWSDEPIAAASVAQLHRARLFDGRDVVVKVQYPGIRDAFIADGKLIALLTPIYRQIFPRGNVEEVIEASNLHMLQECDYRREAAMQTEARRYAQDFPNVVVPEVVLELTSPQVITMEYLAGQRFDEFNATASAAERARAAATIYQYSWQVLFTRGFFNGDPHPGNFLFMPDGRVGCLDFGYAGHLNEARLELWRSVVSSIMAGDRQAFEAKVSVMGFTPRDVTLDFEAVWQVALATMAAIRADGPCRFERGALMRNVEAVTIKTPNRKIMQLPVEDIKFIRFTWCLQGTLAALEGEVHWAKIIAKVLATPVHLDPGPERAKRAS